MTLTKAQKEAMKRYQESEKGKAATKAYEQSEKGIATRKAFKQSEVGQVVAKKAGKNYRNSAKGIATRKAYRDGPEGQAIEKAYQELNAEKIKTKAQAWRDSPEGQAKIKEYQQSEGGKLRDARKRAKRKEYGFKPINNKFLGSDGHHINKEDVLFIPEKLHNSIRHRQDNPESMQIINNASYEWLCTQEILS